MENSLIVDKCQQLLDKINQKLQNTHHIQPEIQSFSQQNIPEIKTTKTNSNAQSISNTIESATKKFDSVESRMNYTIPFIIENEEKHAIENTALIQSFYGTNIDRIQATTTALKYMLNTTSMPEEWIFVEAQKSKSNACFQWLKEYGIKYCFVKIPQYSNGIFLKTPLWNYGAKIAKASRLFFIDSDIVMDSSSWLENACTSLEGHDVASLSRQCLYWGEDRNGNESIGSVFQNLKDYSKISSIGHTGFTFGCTRKAFDILHGFDCSIILDDLDMWFRIVGHKIVEQTGKSKWFPYDRYQKDYSGLPFSIGCSTSTCFHVAHGGVESRKYRQLTTILKDHSISKSNVIEYDKNSPEILPQFKVDNPEGRVIFNSICESATSIENGDDIYFKHAESEYGKIDDDNDLIVCTILKEDFYTRKDDVVKLKENLEQMCNNQFTFICFTNEDLSNYQIDCINLNSKISTIQEQILRKDVDYPSNSSILYVNPTYRFDRRFTMCKCNSNTIAQSYDKQTMYIDSNAKTRKINDIVEKYMNLEYNIK